MEPDIRIMIAAHKEYWVPEDGIYLPLHTGAALDPEDGGRAAFAGFARDDTGDNISEKNREYCELTGLYWAWKNLKAEYIGLVHYRRHFTLHRSSFCRDKKTMPVTREQIAPLLGSSDVILPAGRHYVIETNGSHYAHAHGGGDLAMVRDVICELSPEYAASFDQVMGATCGHRFNMLIMRHDILDAYCSWLFAVLQELEKRIDLSDRSEYDRRVFGFMGERLLDVWIRRQKAGYTELPVVFMERQNWPVKLLRFLERKAAGGRSLKNDGK